jgi:hypothetical protein
MVYTRGGLSRSKRGTDFGWGIRLKTAEVYKSGVKNMRTEKMATQTVNRQEKALD